MTLVFKQITDLSQVDFAGLFIASIPAIDSNFVWPNSITNDLDKQIYYQSQLESGKAGEFKPGDGDVFFMFAVTDETTNTDMMLNAGFITPTGEYHTHWYLTRPDTSGSRNWIYTPDLTNARRAFFTAFGITAYEIRTILNSTIYNTVKQRIASGALTLVNELPTITGDNPLNLVTLIVQV